DPARTQGLEGAGLILGGALTKTGLPVFVDLAFFSQGQMFHFHTLLSEVLAHFLIEGLGGPAKRTPFLIIGAVHHALYAFRVHGSHAHGAGAAAGIHGTAGVLAAYQGLADIAQGLY